MAGRPGPQIAEVAYRPSLGAPIGMDVLDFEELRARGHRRGIDLSAPQRPAFHHLLHLHQDSAPLVHTVDFSDFVLEPGSWLWVRPGQVHQYGRDLPRARGTIVIWQPGFVVVGTPHTQVPLLPSGAHERAIGLALSHLAHEYADVGTVPLDAHIDALRMLLAVLLLRLAHAGPAPAAAVPQDGPFERFRTAVERDFTRTHRVADYATALGYSPRTLTRGTAAATGQTAKQYLDARILLEAKRLLVHSDAPAADIARRLGFHEPGDFAKFFRKRQGCTALAFRATARGTPPPSHGSRRRGEGPAGGTPLGG